MISFRTTTRTTTRRPWRPSSTPPTPSITTYRPVPSYLSSGDGAEEIADILADLIVDQINRGGESSHDTKRRGSNKVLLKLLQALTDEETDPVSKTGMTAVKTTELPLNIQNLPGPPYLPTNYLPPNSLVTRPPSPSIKPPQSVFQTKFESGNFYPTRFTETSLKKFNVEKEEPFLTNMIQSLMSELDKKNENNKYSISNFSPDRKKYKRRKPFKPRPDSPGGGQSVDIVVRDQKTQRRPSVNNNRRPSSSPSDKSADNGPFSRYPVRIPQNTRNPHFSLPIDSLTGFVNKPPAQRISGRTGSRDNISFEEQLSKMMKELGKDQYFS